MCSYFEQQRRKSEKYVRETGGWDPDKSVIIRPTVAADVVTSEGLLRKHWGLVPSWSREAKLKYATFNARAETLTEKPAFRDSWRRSQRCLIPAVSYSEWPVIGGKKVRHAIRHADGAEMLIAGLWSDWSCGEEARATFTMVTTAAVPQIEQIHSRMPRILDQEEADRWLHGAPDECLELLLPRDPGPMDFIPAA